MLLEAAPDQRWPMLLFAAVNLEVNRTGAVYPQDPEELTEFCRSNREALLETIRTRSTQTNDVGRCSYLLPLFVRASGGRPLALIEVGSSRGMLLNCDRYAYDYSGAAAGDPSSPLTISCEVRGETPPLDELEIASRVGIDLTDAAG